VQVKVFTVADRLDEEHQSIKDQLAAKTGADFNKAYINVRLLAIKKRQLLCRSN
jgi:hypothetical protein